MTDRLPGLFPIFSSWIAKLTAHPIYFGLTPRYRRGAIATVRALKRSRKPAVRSGPVVGYPCIDPGQKEPTMAKGQRQSNREPKKPKQPKADRSASTPPLLPAAAAAGDRASASGRDRPGGRNGRR